MSTIETALYRFSELPTEAAKERARQWWRSTDDDDLSDVTDDAVQVAELFGLDIDRVYWSGFWSQGDGASFVGRYRHKPGGMEAVRQYAPQDERLLGIVARLQWLMALCQEEVWVNFSSGGSNYCHEYTMDVNVNWEYDAAPNEAAEAAREHVAEALTEIFRDFARWIYHQLEQEYEYRTSDEYIDEHLVANEYEFNEEGERA